MTTSSARPDYLQRYASLVADRSASARLASTRATVALSAYRSLCADLPVSGHAPTLCDGALARSDVIVAGVRRVAAAFVIADGSDPSERRVIVVDDEQFSRFLPGKITATGDGDHDPEVLYRKGWRHTDDGTHTIGPADLAGNYELFAGAEVTRTSFFDLDKDGLDAAFGYSGFVGARATADGTLDAGVLKGRGHTEVSIGAEASLEANARVNFDEIHADVSGGAFMGGKASLEAELEAMGLGYEGGVEARYGIGADFEAEAHFGWDEISLGANGGFAAGLGFGGRGGFSVNPKETVSNAIRIGSRLPGDVKKGAELVEAKAADLIDDGTDLVSSAYDTGRGTFDDGVDFVRNPLGNTGTVSADFSQLYR